MKTRILIVLLVLAMLAAADSYAQPAYKGGFGIRGGVGADLNFDPAFGAGGSYLVPVQQNYLELGAVLFGGSYNETSDNGFNEYEENTDVFVFGAMANFLFGYEPYKSKTYFVAGMGLASISMSWEERSATDISLGTPLPGGGSMQSEDGGGGGTVFNLGVGHSFASGVDIRGELPVIVAFSAPGEATSVIPILMVTLGYRF